MNLQRLSKGILIAGIGGLMLATGAVAETVTLKVSPNAPTTVPEAFASGDVNIAVVRALNTGDVYQEWIAGVEDEAKRLGAKLTIYNADGDNAKQALQLQQAVSTKPDAILIGWGFGDSLQAGLEAAKAAGIPVVTSNASVEASDHVTNVNQSDKLMMRGIVDKFASDFDGAPVEGEVIYVYVAGYLPLDLRNEIWMEFQKENPGIKQVAQIGVVNANTAAQTADQAKAALSANPNVVAIIAPYDEFTKGATLAIQELGLEDKVKAYGMDISTADIAVMTADNSPWVATATTDMRNFGKVALRVAAGEVADSYEGNDLLIPPLVITREELIEAGVQNVESLPGKFPGLQTPGLAEAPWMKK